MFLAHPPTNATINATECNDRGLICYQSGDLRGALSEFQEAIRIRRDYPEAWNNAGIVLQQLGQVDEAMTHFTRAAALRPDYADALNNRGRLRHLKGDLLGASEDLGAALAVARGPMLATVLHNRAMLRQSTGNLAAALADFDRALKLAPDQVITLRARGLARKSAEDFDGAMADLDRAVALTPPAASAAVLHERGGVKVLLNDWAGAIADYDKALELEPKFWLAFVSRGHARYHRRDFGGVQDYRRAMQLNPEGTVHEVVRLVREDAARDPVAVLKNCDKHLRIDSLDPIAHARRCMTLATLGRHVEAAEQLERFRALAPDLAEHVARVL